MRPVAGRVVFVGGVNSGSPWRPPFLCPEAAQVEPGSAGAAPSAVAAWGQFRLQGAGHVALSRRTPYRVAKLKWSVQPANKRMDQSERGDVVAATHSTAGRALQVMRGR